jgi:uncharacterized protein YutE (UPF0331/DUF86 family)
MGYQDAFRRLGTSGFIPEQLSERLAGWAGFRNVLAHFYPVIDFERVHAALSELDDLESFAGVVARTLDEAGA